ncbi:MAG: putative metal-binding motif-containing protein [Archangium sp.]|nr:putative metal-binding motif-containing protein [Archangium sp.]
MNGRVLAMLCLAVTSCVTRDVPPPSKLAEGCLLNSDCETPLVCVFRRCHQPCSDRRDCPADSDCQLSGDPPQLVCTQVTCADAPCPQGQVCGVDRRCRYQCVTASDCSPKQACVENQCVWNDQLQPDGGYPPPLDGRACEYSSQCAVGERCSRSGQCVAECLTSVDCAATASCLGGRCVPNQGPNDAGVTVDAGLVDAGRPTGGCDYTSQCDAGAVCSSRGVCLPECLTTRDCPINQVCSSSGACEPVMSDGGAGGCTYSSQCPPRQRCGRTGQCEPECLDSRDCTPGDSCYGNGCYPSLGDAGFADGGVPSGWGTTCLVSSQCTNDLICDSRGRCSYECQSNTDCVGNAAGTCCSTNRCRSGSFCSVVIADAGTRDAGTSGLDAGCLADIDCLDNDFCNGAETCRAGRCVSGTNPCFDNNPCTNDICLAASRQCTYQTIATDVDGDGHYPTQCPRDAGAPADDCDDNDNTVYGGALERCDWKDNNCNGTIDESLWRERNGARGVVTAAADYPPSGGAPVAVRVGNEIVVVAASHHVKGTHDAFRLDGTSMSVITGPVALHSANSPWPTCTSSVVRYGNQAILPSLTVTDGGLALASLVARFTNSQAACCSSTTPPLEVRRFEARLTTFAPDLTVRSSTVLQTGTEAAGQCRDFTGISFSQASGTSGFTPIGRIASAYSPTLDQHIATWWDNVSVGNVIGLRFNTVSDAGVLGVRRDVFASATATEPALADTNQSGPQVAVGNRSVLFAWTNAPVQPSVVKVVRWVIYASDLSSVREGPFQFTLPGTGTGTTPWLDSAIFDGQKYVLHVTGSGTTAVASRFLAIDEDGVLLSSRPMSSSQPVSTATEAGWSGGVSTGNAIIGSKGFVTANQQGNFLRLTVGPSNPASPLQVVDTEMMMQPQSSRSDFAVVPLTESSVGLLWTDGVLRKTVFECLP